VNKMNDFTPAEWNVRRENRSGQAEPSLVVCAPNGVPICDLGDQPNELDFANAWLIAAAPEMYAVLDEIMRYGIMLDAPGHESARILERLTRVMKKASGYETGHETQSGG